MTPFSYAPSYSSLYGEVVRWLDSYGADLSHLASVPNRMASYPVHELSELTDIELIQFHNLAASVREAAVGAERGQIDGLVADLQDELDLRSGKVARPAADDGLEYRDALGEFDEGPQGLEHADEMAGGHGVGVDPSAGGQRPDESDDDYHERLFQEREQYDPAPTASGLAHSYREQAGLPHPQTNLRDLRADREKALRVADYFLDPDVPGQDDPAVQAAYQDLVDETERQFQHIKDAGIDVEFLSPEEIKERGLDPNGLNPYPNAKAQAEDIEQNKHLAIASIAAYDAHPLLTDEEYDMFRAVHDFYGHAGVGSGFDRHGEYQSWLHHLSMFQSEGAKAAASAELHGENSSMTQGHIPYAPHKTVLLPHEYISPWDDQGNVIRASVEAMPRLHDPRGNSTDRRRRTQWLLDTYGDGVSAPCVHCGEMVTDETLQQDRIVPGGPYRRDNLQPSCEFCNKSRGNRLDWVTPKLKTPVLTPAMAASEFPSFETLDADHECPLCGSTLGLPHPSDPGGDLDCSECGWEGPADQAAVVDKSLPETYQRRASKVADMPAPATAPDEIAVGPLGQQQLMVAGVRFIDQMPEDVTSARIEGQYFVFSLADIRGVISVMDSAIDITNDWASGHMEDYEKAEYKGTRTLYSAILRRLSPDVLAQAMSMSDVAAQFVPKMADKHWVPDPVLDDTSDEQAEMSAPWRMCPTHGPSCEDHGWYSECEQCGHQNSYLPVSRMSGSKVAKEHHYHLKQEKGKWFVVNDEGDKKNKDGYSTRDEALKLQRALYVNTKDSRVASGTLVSGDYMVAYGPDGTADVIIDMAGMSVDERYERMYDLERKYDDVRAVMKSDITELKIRSAARTAAYYWKDNEEQITTQDMVDLILSSGAGTTKDIADWLAAGKAGRALLRKKVDPLLYDLWQSGKVIINTREKWDLKSIEMPS